MREAESRGLRSSFPVDSEHSALFQCLIGERKETVSRLILTASGGPFRDFCPGGAGPVHCKKTAAHPLWQMGPKVTCDSSTLMNKGLEMIEATSCLVSSLPNRRGSPPQSIIHSLVEYRDGSMKAELSSRT